MQLNIEQIEKDLCRQMALIDLIKRSPKKAMTIATTSGAYTATFGSDAELKADINKQNSVTQRLVDMLAKIRKEESWRELV